jgi:hypothetical protein
MNDASKADAAGQNSGWFSRLNAPLIVAILAAAWAFWDGQRQERQAAQSAIAAEQERSQAALNAEKARTDRAIQEERERRQTQLILLALQAEELEDRREALVFLAQTGLLDEGLATKVLSAVEKGLAPRVGTPHLSSFAKSVQVQVEIDNTVPKGLGAVCANSELLGKQLFLVGPTRRSLIGISASETLPCNTQESGEIVHVNENDARNLVEAGLPVGPIQAEAHFYDIIGLPPSILSPEAP